MRTTHFMQSLPCVKGGAEERGGGIVKSEKIIPQSLRDSPLYTKGPLILIFKLLYKSKFEQKILDNLGRRDYTFIVTTILISQINNKEDKI